MAQEVRLACELAPDSSQELQGAFDVLNRHLSTHPGVVVDTVEALLAGNSCHELDRVEQAVGNVLMASEGARRLGFYPAEAVWPEVWDDPLHHQCRKDLEAAQRQPATEPDPDRERRIAEAYHYLGLSVLMIFAKGVYEERYAVPFPKRRHSPSSA